jgi:hypothetical protein
MVSSSLGEGKSGFLTNNIYFKHLTMETVDPLSLNEGH